MKKYVFSLATVLRVRRIQEEQAAAELAAARAAAAVAAGKEVAAMQALASRCARGGLQPAVSFLAWSEATMLAGEALSAARAEVRRADEEVETARQEWSSAAAGRAALEHLEERGRGVHRRQQRREETKAADDIVTTRGAARRPHTGDGGHRERP